MSRSFFQYFTAAPNTVSSSISPHPHVNLADNISNDTLDAMILEGRRLYPETSMRNTDPKTCDWYTFYQALLPYSLSEAAREVLTQGRYAPYNKKYQFECNRVHSEMARIPEVIAMLEVNGYTVNETIMNSMVRCILGNTGLNIEDMYNRVKKIQERYDPWKISFQACQDVFELSDRFNYSDYMPLDKRDLDACNLNDGLGPIPYPLIVIKRLHQQGKVHDDLQNYLAPILEPICSSDRHPRGKALSLLRILYRFFPEQLQNHLLDIARGFLENWIYKSSFMGPSYSEVARDVYLQHLEQKVILMLGELSLNPIQLANVLSAVDYRAPMLVSVIKAGLLGSDWTSFIAEIIRAHIHRQITQSGTCLSRSSLQCLYKGIQECGIVTFGQSVDLNSVFKEQLRLILLSWHPPLNFGTRAVSTRPANYDFNNIRFSVDVILDALDADDPAIRDVLLSYALVNADAELVSRMVTGVYRPEIDLSSIADPKQITQPVLFTLAHLLILQDRQIRPSKEFTEAILRGAPFKRGYLESTLHTLEKETDIKMREEWYAKKGHNDDRPLCLLFNEKARLEQLDAKTSQEDDESMKEVAMEDHEEGGKFDSETEDEADSARSDDEALDLKGELLPEGLSSSVKINKKYEYIKLQELICRCRSLKLWKDHIDLVHWFEMRQETKERAELEEENERLGMTKKYIRSKFAVGLDVMVKKIDERLKLLESKRDVDVKLRREAVEEARQALMSRSKGACQKKRCQREVMQVSKKSKAAKMEKTNNDSIKSNTVRIKKRAAGSRGDEGVESPSKPIRINDDAVTRRSARLA